MTREPGGMPLYEKLAVQVEELIRRRSLLPGDRIPSVRAMHAQTGASLTTVLQAYVLLESRGVVEARPQSGFYVRGALALPELDPHELIPPAQRETRNIDELVIASFIEATQNRTFIQLAEATPSPDLLPTRHLLRLLGKTCRRGTIEPLLFEHPQGNLELRRQIARRASAWVGPLGTDDILITNGGMESWNLCVRALAKSGETILVQTPTYFGVLEILENLGVKALELPQDPEGVDIAKLSRLFERRKIAAILTLPNFSHPRGYHFSEKSKRELVALCQLRQIPIIEDDIYGELHFGPERAPTLKSMDSKGLVLHCASFSKNVSPGFRVAWIAPGRFKEALLRLKFIASMAAPTLPQIVLAEYLAAGGYDRHLRRVRQQLASRWVAYANAMGPSFPQGTRLARPVGGHAFWVNLPGKIDAVSLYRKALDRGIAIAPGPIFSPSREFVSDLRLSFAGAWSARTAQAVRVLGDLAGEMAPKKREKRKPKAKS